MEQKLHFFFIFIFLFHRKNGTIYLDSLSGFVMLMLEIGMRHTYPTCHVGNMNL